MLEDPQIMIADVHDIPRLVELVNHAYRGPEAKKGWTHEADLIAGDIRTDYNELKRIIASSSAVMLKYTINNTISGCVYLHRYDELLYLGMLSVDPSLQMLGIGKKLLAGAEAYGILKKCSTIEMNVISKRKELIAWYEKHGYRDSGRKRPFHTDPEYGIPREPVEFIIMEKHLNS